MKRFALITAAALAAVGFSLATSSAAPQGSALAPSTASAAVKTYKNCASLNKVYKHGVAKSSTAAAKQVRQGYGSRSPLPEAPRGAAAAGGTRTPGRSSPDRGTSAPQALRSDLLTDTIVSTMATTIRITAHVAPNA